MTNQRKISKLTFDGLYDDRERVRSKIGAEITDWLANYTFRTTDNGMGIMGVGQDGHTVHFNEYLDVLRQSRMDTFFVASVIESDMVRWDGRRYDNNF